MKIGIIGAGFVGKSFAKSVINAGHEVMFSSRTPTPDKQQALSDELGTTVKLGSIPGTLDYSDTIAFAVPTNAIQSVVATGDWSGKVLLDMTQGDSVALANLTGARVVKIFNSIGAEHYQDPMFSGQAASMLYCGDDPDAKAIAAGIASDIGFDPIDIGDLSANGHLVNLAMVWIHILRTTGKRDYAFKMIYK